MFVFNYRPKYKAYIFEQIRDQFINQIESGILKKDSLLPSINDFSDQYGLSKVTVGRAYLHLKYKGYISYVQGKGYFVVRDTTGHLKILFLFDQLNNDMQQIWYGLMDVLDHRAKVYLNNYHDDVEALSQMIGISGVEYDRLVLSSQLQSPFSNHLRKLIQKVPANKLIMLCERTAIADQNYPVIYLNWERDFYYALQHTESLISKYKVIILLTAASNQRSLAICKGIQRFCQQTARQFQLIYDTDLVTASPQSLYIVVEDEMLAQLIRLIRSTDLKLGDDIGIISTKEDALKELLDITVFTADYVQIGRTVGGMILNQEHDQELSAFQVIRRKSI